MFLLLRVLGSRQVVPFRELRGREKGASYQYELHLHMQPAAVSSAHACIFVSSQVGFYVGTQVGW